jgi:hypothetical protein
MPKKQSEIFENLEGDNQEPQTPAKKTTIKEKKQVSAERLEQLKEQLARGRAVRLAKRELIENEKKSRVSNTKTETEEPSKPVQKKQEEVTDTRPVANQLWGEEIAELKNEIKSLKSRLDKPKPVHATTPVKVPEKIISPVSKKDNVIIPRPTNVPKKVVESPKPPPSQPISIPKPKPNIYSAFKVALW